MKEQAKRAVLERVRQTIKEKIRLERGTRIIYGFSGGPDSTCLLDALLQISAEEELGFAITAVHVNHMLRGEAADADEQFCARFAAQRGLALETFRIDVTRMAAESHLTTEEAGRLARYQAFRTCAAAEEQKLAIELSAGTKPKPEVVIAVAQNADDQAETVLYRILRGTGTDGLAGIGYSRRDESGFRVVRPLLDCDRASILAYLEAREIRPCLDATNDEPLYARNRIRLELLPELEGEYNPRLREALVHLAAAAAEDRAYLEAEAARQLDNCRCPESGAATAAGNGFRPEGIYLDMEKLRVLDPAIRRRVVALALQETGLLQDMAYVHFQAIDRLLAGTGPGAGVDLPHGYRAEAAYGSLRLGKAAPEADEAARNALAQAKLRLWECAPEEAGAAEPGNYRFCFDRERLAAWLGPDAEQRIVLRTRRAGDSLKMKGGSKKIQDLLVDRKVPKEERDRVLLIACGSRVLAVVGRGTYGEVVRKTAEAALTEETKKVVCIELVLCV